VVNPLRPPVLLRNRHPSRTTEIRSHYTIETTRNLFFLSPVRCTHSSRKDRQGILVLTLRVSVSPSLPLPAFGCAGMANRSSTR
jgi:hypothetical protein